MPGPPPALVDLQAEVDAALTGALDRLLPRVVDLHPTLEPMTRALREFTTQGKRIRPVLLLLGYRAGGGRDHHRVLGPALALELLHTCALIHDDVIDRAATRRGRPTVHAAASAAHRDAGWMGAADDAGAAVAILVGDLAFVYADELFLEADVPADRLLAAFRRFTVLREEVTAGQYLDLHAARSRATDRGLALTVATLKSGRYSVARPLQIGAILAGANAGLVDGLGQFGDPVGRAFQVRDDLLGVFGEESVTGKSAASDLAEGKRTLLIAEAARRLDADGLRALEAGLGDPGLEEDEVARLRALLEGSGARSATEDYVQSAIAESDAALARLALSPEVERTLRAVAHYLGERDR